MNRREKIRASRVVTSSNTRSKPRDADNTSKDTRTCHHCNRPGHIARYCPKKKQEANLVGEDEDVDEL